MKEQFKAAWNKLSSDVMLAKKQKRGMQQLSAIAVGVGAFAIALITVVLVAVIVANLQNSSSITQNGTAWTIANNTLTMLVNFSAQLGLAGTVLGFVVIFGGLAYLGVFVYQHVRDR